MKRAVWLGMGIALGAAFSAGAQGLLGPEGEFDVFLFRLEWKPKCSAPTWPSARTAGDWEISRAKSDWDSYRACVVRQAKSDAPYASQLVYDAAIKAIEAEKQEAASRGWTFN